jgi:hypothetical protein
MSLINRLFARPVARTTSRPTAFRTRLGGDGLALETREVASITPAMASMQLQTPATISALASVPVNRAAANGAAQEARTVRASIATSANPVDVQNRATIDIRSAKLTAELAQYDSARIVLQSTLANFGSSNAALQATPFLVPASTLAQQRTVLADMTARLSTEAADVRSATSQLYAVVDLYGGMPVAASDPAVGRVNREIERARVDVVRGSTVWLTASQILQAGVMRYEQLLTQVGVLEQQRLALLGLPFASGQVAALSSMITVYRMQTENLGNQLVVLNQAMTRQYEAVHGLQVAVDRAGVAKTTATVTELNQIEINLITLRAKLSGTTPMLQASVAAVNGAM